MGELLDRFGGWYGVTSNASGFFRVEKLDDRWWFIDPDGNAFIGLGVQHVSPSLLQFPWNKHIWIDKYGNNENFYLSARDEIRGWGFNCCGFYGRIPGMPYNKLIKFAPISGYLAGANFREDNLHLPRENYPDVFSREWVEDCIIRAESCRDFSQDWMLMGYWIDDVPVWDEGEYWIEGMVNKGGDGLNRFIDFLKNRYDDNINEFNSVYGSEISCFSDVVNIFPLRETLQKKGVMIVEDVKDFMRIVSRQYYMVIADCIRHFDKNHLIFGDAYDMNTQDHLVIGDRISDYVLEEAKPFVDVLGLQGYQLEPMDNQISNIIRWQGISQKPVILTDFCYPSPPSDLMPHPFGPPMKSHKERGEMYRDYFNAIFRLPFVIGLYWCGYIDQRMQSNDPLERDRQHSGLKNELDQPHHECIEIIKKTNYTVYDVTSMPPEK